MTKKERRREKNRVFGHENALHRADNKLRVFIHVLASKPGRNAIGRSVIPRPRPVDQREDTYAPAARLTIGDSIWLYLRLMSCKSCASFDPLTTICSDTVGRAPLGLLTRKLSNEFTMYVPCMSKCEKNKGRITIRTVTERGKAIPSLFFFSFFLFGGEETRRRIFVNLCFFEVEKYRIVVSYKLFFN